MRNRSIYLLLFAFLVLTGCKKEEEIAEPIPTFYNFSFLKKDNPGLTSDIKFSKTGQKFSGNLPFDVDIKQMVATFNYTGTYVSVNNQTQYSGITVNDFSQTVTYVVKNQVGTSVNYEVNAVWFTGLPVCYIYTDGGLEIESKEDYLTGYADIFGGRSYDDNSGEMKIRGRGHSTWGIHPKKPYQLKFDDKTEVLGMPADKKWIFLAEHSDKTLIRNNLAFEMGYLSNLDWTPQSVYSEVFVNNDYRGTYNITQKVEEGEHRVNIGSTGYLLEIDVADHLDPGDIYFNSSKFLIQIKEPETSFNSEEFNYIKNYIIEFENVLYSENFTNSETGYQNYVDVESVVDWYLINEIAKNQDARSYSSIYLNLIPGQKLKMGPIWDFDLGFGNVNYSECEYPTNFWVKYHAWINRMFEDPDFISRVKERFVYFKNNEDHLLDYIDNSASHLQLAQYENDNRWNVFGNWIWPNAVVFDTHQEEVNYLKNWLIQRMEWLDNEYKGM